MEPQEPAIQLIANLVVQRDDGQVLLAQYNPAGETSPADTNGRWWLPAHELDQYQHPDDAASHALDSIGGLEVESINLVRVQSFEGRRGWHISFDYSVKASGNPESSEIPAAWFALDNLPATMHGDWEQQTIDAVLASETERTI